MPSSTPWSSTCWKRTVLLHSPHSPSKLWFSTLNIRVLLAVNLMPFSSVSSVCQFLSVLTRSVLFAYRYFSSYQSTRLYHHHTHTRFYQNCEALSEMFTQLSPRACWLTPVGSPLRFWLGSCALVTLDFLPFAEERCGGGDCVWAPELVGFSAFKFCRVHLGLFKTHIVELYPRLWPWNSPRAASLSQTVSRSFGASLRLRKDNLGLSVY